MGIQLQNVSIKKNEVEILKDLSIDFSDRDNRIVLGESGSGKSTFLDLIAGKIFPSQGKILKSKGLKVILASRDYSFHKIIGQTYQYYQQRYNAYDSELGPTVYEVFQNQILPIGTIDLNSVELPPLAYTPEEVYEVAQRFKVDHLLDRKVTSLSNGETRRTLLAYWFLKKPDVLLLDNPFSGLDSESRELLKEIMGNLEGTGIFLVSELKDRPKGFEKGLILKAGGIAYHGSLNGIGESLEPEEKIRDPFEIYQYFEKIKTAPITYETALKLVNVGVKYHDKLVLNDINLEIKRGECWAILGPNGSGKTTLTSLLTGDNPQAYSNEIYLFDKRRGTGESIWDIKSKVGFVSPELHLFFPKRTPVWKAAGSGFYDTMGLYRKLSLERLELIDSFLRFFDLEKQKETPLEFLSSGQQRLVLLARALIKKPEMLILDEPCQGLDYNQMVFFRDILDEIVPKLGLTLIYITHYMEEIPRCVDKRLYLDEGRIVRVEP